MQYLLIEPGLIPNSLIAEIKVDGFFLFCFTSAITKLFSAILFFSVSINSRPVSMVTLSPISRFTKVILL